MASNEVITPMAEFVGPSTFSPPVNRSLKRASPNQDPQPPKNKDKTNEKRQPQVLPPFQNIRHPEVQSKPALIHLDDDDDDDDEDMSVDDEDVQSQQNLLDIGAKSQAERRSTPMKIPEEIRKMNRELSPLVRQWWKGGAIPKSHEASFGKIEIKVNKICHEIAEKEFAEALQQELRKQVDAKQIAADDESKKQQFKKDFWEYGSRSTLDSEKPKWNFSYFDELSPGEKPQAWMHKWKSYAEVFRFPKSQIQGHILSLGTSMKKVEKLKEQIKNLQVDEVTDNMEEKNEGAKSSHEELTRELSKTKKNVIEGALIFTQIIDDHQLEAKLLIPDQYKVLFSDLVNESEATKSTHRKFLSNLMNPLEEQKEIWEVARPEMKAFFQQAVNSQGNIPKMKEIVDGMREKNEKLALTNQEMGIVSYDHQIPYSDMKAIVRNKERKQDGEVEKRLKKIKALMAVWWDHSDLQNVFPSQVGDVRLSDEQLLEQREKLLRITQGEDSQPLFESLSSSSLDTVPEPKSSSPETASQLASHSSNPPSTDIENIIEEFELEDDTIQMMLYDDGRTEYGKIEATRPCRTGNIRFSRFIVNAGTENAPFYKVIKGSDLGPGGAETFHENKWQSLHTRFDLATRKQSMKQVGGCTIKSIGPCIEMAQESSPRLTKSGKPYRPDMYVKVQYHEDKAKNPDSDSHSTIEWLTRTELGQLMGKKYAETQEKILMAKYKKRQMYFDECKKQQLNPETKQPLSAEDSEVYPWLLSDDAVLPKATVTKQTDNDGDHDMGMDEDL